MAVEEFILPIGHDDLPDQLLAEAKLEERRLALIR